MSVYRPGEMEGLVSLSRCKWTACPMSLRDRPEQSVWCPYIKCLIWFPIQIVEPLKFVHYLVVCHYGGCYVQFQMPDVDCLYRSSIMLLTSLMELIDITVRWLIVCHSPHKVPRSACWHIGIGIAIVPQVCHSMDLIYVHKYCNSFHAGMHFPVGNHWDETCRTWAGVWQSN